MVFVLMVVFDVETKRAFDEVGGFFPAKLGVSLVGVWSGEVPDNLDSLRGSKELSRQGGIKGRDDKLAMEGAASLSSESEGEYRAYREEGFAEMFKLFERADRVVGYNSINFDYVALQPYYSGSLASLPTLDIMAEVERDVGYRVRLDAIAKETLGMQKFGSGLDAIEYYNQGDWESLEKYCLQDVKVTKEIYDYGKRNGVLKFKNKWNRLVEARVDFERGSQDKQVQSTFF